jgi:hemoglobin
LVDSFVARAAADDRINQKFARADVPRLKKEFIDQLCEATGGPCAYTGQSKRDAHAVMKVGDGEFDAFIQDLEATLGEFQIPWAGRAVPPFWAAAGSSSCGPAAVPIRRICA